MRFTRQQGVFHAAAFLALTASLLALAADRAADPVLELREALKVTVRDPKKNEAELDFRKQNLSKRIEALKTLGDLRRALQLQEWRDKDLEESIQQIDQPLRARVVAEFLKGMRAVLSQGAPISQQAAADLLADMGSNIRGADEKGVTQQLAPELARLCRSPEPRVRQAAARALGKIQPDPLVAVPALGEMLAHDRTPQRTSAAEALANLVQGALLKHKGRTEAGVGVTRADLIRAGTRVVPEAGTGISDQDGHVRRLCAQTLRYAAEALSEMIFDPRDRSEFPPEGRQLTDAERTSIDEYAQEVESERRELTPLMVAFKEQTSALSRALRDGEVEVRLAALKSLEELGNARQRLARRAASVPLPDKSQLPAKDDHLLAMMHKGKDVLADRIKDQDVRVRLEALNVLETLERDAAFAIDCLVPALTDADRFVRWAAVRVLGKTAPAEARTTVPALTRLLRDQDLDVRVTTADALSRYGPSAHPALQELRRSVTTGDADIRAAAIRAIVSIGSAAQPAIPTLVEALHDADAEVRKSAAEALGRFGPAAHAAIEPLRRKLDEDDPEVRKAASDALLSIVP